MALIAGAFLLAGLVKGVVGLGLPTVSLALLAATLGVKYAIALMLVPSLVTNVWQALTGGALVSILKRTWTILAMACIGIWFGAELLARADAELVGAAFGLLLCVYCGLSLATPQIPPPGRREIWLSPLVGAVAGVITGLTSTSTNFSNPTGTALASNFTQARTISEGKKGTKTVLVSFPGSFCMPVRKGEYWKLQMLAAPAGYGVSNAARAGEVRNPILGLTAAPEVATAPPSVRSAGSSPKP